MDVLSAVVATIAKQELSPCVDVDHRVGVLFEKYFPALSQIFLNIVDVQQTYLYIVCGVRMEAKIGLEFSRKARGELV